LDGVAVLAMKMGACRGVLPLLLHSSNAISMVAAIIIIVVIIVLSGFGLGLAVGLKDEQRLAATAVVNTAPVVPSSSFWVARCHHQFCIAG
jgi:hypothetical protein